LKVSVGRRINVAELKGQLNGEEDGKQGKPDEMPRKGGGE